MSKFSPRGTGWRRQTPDHRDHAYSLKLHGALTSRPSSWDNRQICSPVEDQKQLGSCTAHMLAALVECNEAKRHRWFRRSIRVSRLFEYYATRRLGGTTREDSGASIRDAVKAAARFGVADEKLWPYDPDRFAQNPPWSAWAAALSHRVTSYHSIADGDLETMKVALSQGFLVGFGMTVHESLVSDQVARTGVAPLPGPIEKVLGGHAVALAGYDDARKMFLVRNSWGTGWGQKGYFWLPYEFVGDVSQCNDFWVVVSSPL